MNLLAIILFILASISAFCAWFVPRQLRKRWERKYKYKEKNSPSLPQDKGYATVGELPAGYLDKVADRIIGQVLLGMWHIMIAFLAIILAVIGLIVALGF